MKIKMITLALVTLLASCQKEKFSKIESDCLKGMLSSKKKGSGIKEVFQFDFETRSVFVLVMEEQGNDVSSIVLDKNCQTVGLLGGVSGTTVLGGMDFSNPVKVTKIW